MSPEPCPDFDELVDVAGSPVGIRIAITVFVWSLALTFAWRPLGPLMAVVAFLAFLWVAFEYVIVTGELSREAAWGWGFCPDVSMLRTWLFLGGPGDGSWEDVWLPRLRVAALPVLVLAVVVRLLQRA